MCDEGRAGEGAERGGRGNALCQKSCHPLGKHGGRWQAEATAILLRAIASAPANCRAHLHYANALAPAAKRSDTGGWNGWTELGEEQAYNHYAQAVRCDPACVAVEGVHRERGREGTG